MFSDRDMMLWLIPLLPLLGSVVIAAVGPAAFPDKCHCRASPARSGRASLRSSPSSRVATGDDAAVHHRHSTSPGSRPATSRSNFSLRADGLTAIMLVMVTFIGSLIAIYSAGYMHGDPGYPRFFAAVSLFLFFMTGLVLANNFILLYACWEGVGLCSYLLIGFWFAKPSAAAAARKAFLVTRLGDIGLFIGILILWYTLRRIRSNTTTSSPTPQAYHAATASCSGPACCLFSARSASRRSSRCTSGCPTRWKARRRSAP